MRAKKRAYPPYEYKRTKNIWASREELLAYERELEREAHFEELLNGGWQSKGSRSRRSKSKTPSRAASRMSATPARSTTKSEPATPANPIRDSGKENTVKEEMNDDVVLIEAPLNTQSESPQDSVSVARARELRGLLEPLFEQWQELVQLKSEDPPRPGGLQRFESGQFFAANVTLHSEIRFRTRAYTHYLQVCSRSRHAKRTSV